MLTKEALPKYEKTDCDSCPKVSQCNIGNGTYKIKKIYKVSNVCEYIVVTMALRNEGYYSFRGQRACEWDLGIGYKYRKLPIPLKIKIIKLSLNDEEKKLINKYYEEKDNHYYLKAAVNNDDKFAIWNILFNTGVVSFNFRDAPQRFRVRNMELPKPNYLEEHDQWRWLFYAQHHGMLTRLLDWTSNPLVALYYSVENIISNERDDTSGCVWAIKVTDSFFKAPEEISGPPGKILTWLMINPAPITMRMSRQSSKFSFHPDIDGESILIPSLSPQNSFLPIIDNFQREQLFNFSKHKDETINMFYAPKDNDHYYFKKIEDKQSKLYQALADDLCQALEQLRNQQRQDRKEEIVKICISPNNDISPSLTIRRELGIMNVHHASLFPDADGIAQFINLELPNLEPMQF